MSVFACTAAWTISAAQSLPAEPVGAAPTPAMPVAEQGLAGPAAKAGVANPGAQTGADRSVASPGDVPMPIDKRGNNALTAGPDPRVQFPQTHVTMPPFWHARRGRAGARRTGPRRRRTTHALAGIGTLVQSDAGSARSAGRHDPAGPEFGRSAAAVHAEAGPAPAGSRLDGTMDARRQVDAMQRKVDGMLRNANTLSTPSR